MNTLPATAPVSGDPAVSGPYFQDLLAQPDALRAAVAGLLTQPPTELTPEGLRQRGINRIVLTGMGSSFFALQPLQMRLNRESRPCFLVETSELLLGYEGLYGADSMLIAVSQSGESAEVVQLLGRTAEFGLVVAVTNSPGSCLARNATLSLLLHAGTETTVSCKTYVNSLAVLHWLGTVMTGGDAPATAGELATLPATAAAYLGAWRRHLADLSAVLRGVTSIFITGRGASLATTGTAGLILKESTRRHAEGMSCAAFRHGPYEMVGDHVFLLAFAGESRTASLNRRLVEDVRRAGGRAAFAASDGASAEVFCLPALAPLLLPVAEIWPVQMMSLALAHLDGREAGRFERATKVTSIA